MKGKLSAIIAGTMLAVTGATLPASAIVSNTIGQQQIDVQQETLLLAAKDNTKKREPASESASQSADESTIDNIKECEQAGESADDTENINSNQDDTENINSNQDDPENDNTNQDKPGKDNPKTDKPGKDNPKTDKPGKDNPKTDKPGKDNTKTDKPGKDNTNQDELALTLTSLTTLKPASAVEQFNHQTIQSAHTKANLIARAAPRPFVPPAVPGVRPNAVPGGEVPGQFNIQQKVIDELVKRSKNREDFVKGLMEEANHEINQKYG